MQHLSRQVSTLYELIPQRFSFLNQPTYCFNLDSNILRVDKLCLKFPLSVFSFSSVKYGMDPVLSVEVLFSNPTSIDFETYKFIGPTINGWWDGGTKSSVIRKVLQRDHIVQVIPLSHKEWSFGFSCISMHSFLQCRSYI